jgi:hypothetical protein
MLKSFEKRLRGLSATQASSLILSALIAIVWMYLTTFFLTPHETGFLSKLQIDKLIHFSGGLAAAGILFLALGLKFPKTIIISVLFIGLLWEIWELKYLSSQLNLFINNFYIWFFDTLGDLAADILGAIFWIKISRK